MKKLFILTLFPMIIGCSKSADVSPTPAAPTSPAMKTTGGGKGGPTSSTTYQLVSFSVSKSGPSSSWPMNTILWTAIGETNISHYEVEVSGGNNYSWQTMTTPYPTPWPAGFLLSSNSNTSITRSHGMVAAGGTTYFRLKIFHMNNSITYSTIKKVVWQTDLWANW